MNAVVNLIRKWLNQIGDLTSALPSGKTLAQAISDGDIGGGSGSEVVLDPNLIYQTKIFKDNFDGSWKDNTASVNILTSRDNLTVANGKVISDTASTIRWDQLNSTYVQRLTDANGPYFRTNPSAAQLKSYYRTQRMAVEPFGKAKVNIDIETPSLNTFAEGNDVTMGATPFTDRGGYKSYIWKEFSDGVTNYILKATYSEYVNNVYGFGTNIVNKETGEVVGSFGFTNPCNAEHAICRDIFKAGDAWIFAFVSIGNTGTGQMRIVRTTTTFALTHSINVTFGSYGWYKSGYAYTSMPQLMYNPANDKIFIVYPTSGSGFTTTIAKHNASDLTQAESFNVTFTSTIATNAGDNKVYFLMKKYDQNDGYWYVYGFCDKGYFKIKISNLNGTGTTAVYSSFTQQTYSDGGSLPWMVYSSNVYEYGFLSPYWHRKGMEYDYDHTTGMFDIIFYNPVTQRIYRFQFNENTGAQNVVTFQDNNKDSGCYQINSKTNMMVKDGVLYLFGWFKKDAASADYFFSYATYDIGNGNIIVDTTPSTIKSSTYYVSDSSRAFMSYDPLVDNITLVKYHTTQAPKYLNPTTLNCSYVLKASTNSRASYVTVTPGVDFFVPVGSNGIELLVEMTSPNTAMSPKLRGWTIETFATAEDKKIGVTEIPDTATGLSWTTMLMELTVTQQVVVGSLEFNHVGNVTSNIAPRIYSGDGTLIMKGNNVTCTPNSGLKKLALDNPVTLMPGQVYKVGVYCYNSPYIENGASWPANYTVSGTTVIVTKLYSGAGDSNTSNAMAVRSGLPIKLVTLSAASGSNYEGLYISKALPLDPITTVVKFYVDQSLGNGSIEWFITNDNWITTIPVSNGSRVVFDNADAFSSVIKVKASIKAGSGSDLPVVREYRMITKWSAALKEFTTLRINLAKTNFKFATLQNCIAYSLNNLIIDVLTDTSNIDIPNSSNYSFDSSGKQVVGSATNGFVRTISKLINEPISTILVSADVIGNVEFQISADGGTTYKNISLDTVTSLDDITNTGNIVLKMIFKDGTTSKVSAYSISWS